MKKATVKSVKDRIKDKLAETKEKVKSKLKGAKASVAAVAAVVSLVMCGCMDTAPASRATTATYKFAFSFDDSARNNTLNITLGDGALASADSEGSTETQTATPTLDIRTRIDARYNDAVKNATDASKDVLSSLTKASAEQVLDMMLNKKSGAVKVTKTDGTEATVECKDGQCSFYNDGDETYGPSVEAVK